MAIGMSSGKKESVATMVTARINPVLFRQLIEAPCLPFHEPSWQGLVQPPRSLHTCEVLMPWPPYLTIPLGVEGSGGIGFPSLGGKGTRIPEVRLSGMRYRLATRWISSGVTFR